MKKLSKTNVCRILDKEKIEYKHIEKEEEQSFEDVGADSKLVFKTLVLVGSDKNNYVCVIPRDGHLDLKKAAKAFNIKSIQMLPQRELKDLTGYIHGGCSPIGMKSKFDTLIDISAKEMEVFIISAGKVQNFIYVNPLEIKNTFNFEFTDLVE